MKKLIYIVVINILFPLIVFSSVNTRLILVTNDEDTPSAGKGTMIIKVQAISTSANEQINTFQDAFQLDNTFRNQNLVVSFSNQLFPDASYTVSESYSNSDGAVRYTYTFDGGTRGEILTSYTDVVTVSIEYDMDETKNTTIDWFGGIPNYLVTDENDQGITGIEESIPSSLQNVPLPVELTSFYSMVADSKVKLLWETATEVQNYGFEVERAPDAEEKVWENIGFVSGHGNSNSPKKYSFDDNDLNGSSKFYYRLKQVDVDGGFEYSDVISVEFDLSSYNLEQNYPNPFNPETVIKFAIPKDEIVKLFVFNIIGQKVATLVDGYLEKGFYKMNFDARNYGDELSSGIYIYQLETPSFSQTKKMILVK